MGAFELTRASVFSKLSYNVVLLTLNVLHIEALLAPDLSALLIACIFLSEIAFGRLVEKPFNSLELNHDGVMYLTQFVERNRTLHLSQRADFTRHVSLIAFISYQYFKGHDVLADILLQSVQSIETPFVNR